MVAETREEDPSVVIELLLSRVTVALRTDDVVST